MGEIGWSAEVHARMAKVDSLTDEYGAARAKATEARGIYVTLRKEASELAHELSEAERSATSLMAAERHAARRDAV